MPRSKTYDVDRVPNGKRSKPDGRDDGSGGPIRKDRLDDDGNSWEGVPYWYINDDQGDIPDEDANT